MTRTSAAPPSPAQLLAEQASARATGILHAVRGKHKRLICMEKGVVTFVMSNVIEEQFDATLVREGLLTPAQQAEAKVSAPAAKMKLSAYLVERKIIENPVLERVMEAHVRQLSLSTLEWPDGQYKFDRGRPDLAGEIVTKVGCAALLMEHARRHPASIDEVRVRIGPPNIRPVRSKHADRIREGLTLDDASVYLVEHCDGSKELATLVENSELQPEAILRALYGLLLAGVLQSAETVEASGAARLSQVGREECEARLHQADGADHYLVLGVDSRAPETEIRDAYYLLARRFHPDRFRVGELKDLLPRVEVYFTQVTEAYNTLSDAELRKNYDTELAEAVGRKKVEPTQDRRQLARENYARAKMLLEKKRLQDAVTFLENAIQLDESNATYHLELGQVLLLNPRRRSDCETHLVRALELDPTSIPGFMAMGELYSKTGRKDQARRMFNEVLRWEPEDAEAKRLIKAL